MKDILMDKLQSKDLEQIASAFKELNKMEYIPMRYEKIVLELFENGVLRNTDYTLPLKEKLIKQGYYLRLQEQIIFEDDFMDSFFNCLDYTFGFEELGLSDELLAKCSAWQDIYNEKFSLVYEPNTPEEVIAEYKKHLDKAFELVKQIKKEVKSRYKIAFENSKDTIYYFCLDQGILRDEWGKPVMLHEICDMLGIKSDDDLEQELCKLGAMWYDGLSALQAYEIDAKKLNKEMMKIANKLELILPKNVVLECKML